MYEIKYFLIHFNLFIPKVLDLTLPKNIKAFCDIA